MTGPGACRATDSATLPRNQRGRPPRPWVEAIALELADGRILLVVDRLPRAQCKPEGEKTPTLGKDSSFFEELFGNIGQVGSVGESGGTADNPN